MPARKKPVKNRNIKRLVSVLSSQIIAMLHKAPRTADIRNTFDGENRSAMVSMAKINVPIIKPNCTDDVR